MKTLLKLTVLSLALTGTSPVLAADFGQSTFATDILSIWSGDADEVERRGRGRGGRDGIRNDDRGGSGGHGGRPRIPGGSGCDDPQDLIEHPECRV